MALDRALLEETSPPVTAEVERGRIRLFAAAIGETDPVHHDVDAARAAGHPDLLAPPTFLFGIELEQSDTLDVLARYGADLGRVLHGEQTFRYYAPVHAGDTVTMSGRFSDVYSKSGGRLDFVVRVVDVHRDGELVAQLESTTVVRNPAPEEVPA